MNKKIKILGCLVFGFLSFILFSGTAVVADNKDSNMAFDVEPKLPENQMVKDLSYYFLKMEPGKEQDIEFTIKNNDENEGTFTVALNRARTNPNGVLDFSSHGEKKDKTLKVDFEDVATIENADITIPAKSKKVVKVSLKMPKESFEGVILGGIYVTKKIDENQDDKKDKEETSVQFQNRMAYALNVMIQEKSPYEGKPDLKLKKLEPTLVNQHSTLVATFQNPMPNLLFDLSVKAEVLKKGQKDKPLEKKDQADIKLAPNSEFHYQIDWSDDKFEPGDYVFKAVAISGEDNWVFEEPFTIKKDEANNLEKNRVSFKDTEKKTNLIPIIVILILVIVILVIVLVIINKKKKTSKVNKSKKKKKKKKRKKSN